MTLSAVASFTASCVVTYAVQSIVSWGVRKADLTLTSHIAV